MLTKKTLVTGATGFIGSHIVRELLQAGEDVKVLIRKDSDTKNLDGLDIEHAYGDLCDKNSLFSALNDCDRLFHTAALNRVWMADSQFFYDINVEGTKNILNIALKKNVERVVYTSSLCTVGANEDGSLANEETRFNLWDISNHYERSKFQAEEEAFNVFKKGLPLVVVNPGAVVGPNDIKPTPTGQLIVNYLNRNIPAYFDTRLNIVHVKDVAAGHLLACSKGRIGEKYILGNENMKISDFLRLLENVSGIKAPKIKVPQSLALMIAYLNDFISSKFTKKEPIIRVSTLKRARLDLTFDSTKAVSELGLRLTPIKEAVIEAMNWFRENGYVNR